MCYAPVNTLPEALDAAADKLLRDEQDAGTSRRRSASATSPPGRACASRASGEHDALKKR